MKTRQTHKLETWLDDILRKIPSEMASVMLIIPDDDYLEIVAHRGFIVAPELHLALGHGIAGNVAETGEPAMVNEVDADPRFVAAQHGTEQLICVPIRNGAGDVIGVLNLSNPPDKNKFEQSDLEMAIEQVKNFNIEQDEYVLPEI